MLSLLDVSKQKKGVVWFCGVHEPLEIPRGDAFRTERVLSIDILDAMHGECTD